jgi:hypothetical protein
MIDNEYECIHDVKVWVIKIGDEYFYQPNIYTTKDYLINGSFKVVLPINKYIGFSISQNLNYVSLNQVRVIQNITFGIDCEIKN